MGSNKTNASFKRKLIGMAVISCFAGNTAHAAPTGASVASGSVSIATSGSTMTVTNTPNAIINWASFSINTNETVRFVQQSATSAVLNRVTGSDPSSILGALQSNGKVFLINPNGIMFGAGARIDVNGLVASTLNMTDADFLNGRMRFNADRAVPGNVSNAGEIRTPAGGFVYLLAPNVENSGIITTPSGEAILAAGNSVELVDSVNPSQRVLVSAKSQDVNLSQLMTESNGNIFSVLNSGKVSANTVVQDQTGKIYFKSAGNIQTTATSVVEAKGDSAANGGRIQAFADNAGFYAGAFDISGKNGGFIETSGGYLDVDGISLNLRALDPAGKGGTWLLDPYDILIDNSTATYGGCTGSAPSQDCFATSSHIYVGTIQTALSSGGDVIISTSDSSGTGTGVGDITLNAGITYTAAYGAHLFLDADHDIIFTATGDISNVAAGAGPLAVTLDAGNDIFFSSGASIIDIKGGMYATAGRNIVANGQITSPEVHLFATGDITVGGTITAIGSTFHTANIHLDAGGNIVTSANLHAFDANAHSEVILDAGGNITVGADVHARSFSSYGSTVDISADNLVTINGDVMAYGYGSTSVFIDGIAGGITISQPITSNAYGSGINAGDAFLSLFSDGPIAINGTSVMAKSTAGSAYLWIDSSNSISATNSSVFADGAIDSALLLLSDALPGTITIDNASVFSTSTSGSALLTISSNDITLQNNAALEADDVMYFDFPLLASGGWQVDGIVGAFGNSSSGSFIEVASATPILNSNFFVTYGGLSGTLSGTIGSINNDVLTAADTPVIIQDTTLAIAPTASDFFGSSTSDSTSTMSDAGTGTSTDTGSGADSSTDSGTGTDSGATGSAEETVSIGDTAVTQQPSEQEQQDAEEPQQCS